MPVKYEGDFAKQFAKLPQKTQVLVKRQLAFLEKDPRDPRLHLKKLRGYHGVFSFRATRSYRGLFYIDDQSDIVVFDIDHRKDIYR